MKLAFTLSMSGIGSWNGKWSGEGKLYVKTRSIRDRKLAEKILEKKYYSYRWDDGWAAAVTVEEITPSVARILNRKSAGFCGYDWMIDSIIKYQKIMNSTEQVKYENQNSLHQ